MLVILLLKALGSEDNDSNFVASTVSDSMNHRVGATYCAHCVLQSAGLKPNSSVEQRDSNGQPRIGN